MLAPAATLPRGGAAAGDRGGGAPACARPTNSRPAASRRRRVRIGVRSLRAVAGLGAGVAGLGAGVVRAGADAACPARSVRVLLWIMGRLRGVRD
jgi:hypothetical protein